MNPSNRKVLPVKKMMSRRFGSSDEGTNTVVAFGLAELDDALFGATERAGRQRHTGTTIAITAATTTTAITTTGRSPDKMQQRLSSRLRLPMMVLRAQDHRLVRIAHAPSELGG